MIVEALQQILNLMLSVLISLPDDNLLSTLYNVLNLILQLVGARL